MAFSLGFSFLLWSWLKALVAAKSHVGVVAKKRGIPRKLGLFGRRGLSFVITGGVVMLVVVSLIAASGILGTVFSFLARADLGEKQG
jgi:hypothetical protein